MQAVLSIDEMYRAWRHEAKAMSKGTTIIQSFVLAAALTLGASTARADGVVEGGQFAAAVEHGQPTGGDAATIATQNRVYYFIRLNNPHGDEVTFTVQWSVNGVARNPMTIRARGRSNWVFQPIRASTRNVSIVIRDEHGTQIHSDQLTIRQ